MRYSILDNGLHVTAGAALALPLVLLPGPVATFCVFSVWGLLREQAQKNERSESFSNNWLHIWNGNNLIEGFAWGVGGGFIHGVVVLMWKWQAG